MEGIPIRLGSMERRSRQIRNLSGQGVAGGRAWDTTNMNIERTNEPEKRKGYIRRLHDEYTDPVRLLAPYAGVCGRFLRYLDGAALILIAGCNIQSLAPIAQNISASALASFRGSRTGSIVLSWTYAGGKETLNEGCEGVRILRRYDELPDSPNDPDATVVYEGPLATYTDPEPANDQVTYYAAYPIYPSTGFGPASELTVASALIFEDNFNRSDGTPIDADHPWVHGYADVANQLRILNSRLAVKSGTFGVVYATVADLQAEAPCRIECNIYPDLTDNGDQNIALGYSSLDGTLLIYGTVLLDAVNPGKYWELRLDNGPSAVSGVTHTGEAPAAGVKATLQRTGSVLTFTYNGETITLPWSAPGEVVYPVIWIAGGDAADCAIDNFRVWRL